VLCQQQISVEEEKVAKITRAIESEKQKMLQKAKAKSSKEEVCMHCNNSTYMKFHRVNI
jgi:hypothetical protein